MNCIICGKEIDGYIYAAENGKIVGKYQICDSCFEGTPSHYDFDELNNPIPQSIYRREKIGQREDK